MERILRLRIALIKARGEWQNSRALQRISQAQDGGSSRTSDGGACDSH